MNLRDAMRDIYEAHGRLTNELVVETAADEDHEMHDAFEWDDSIAGPKYRLVQAGRLIRRVQYVYRPATETEPARTTREWIAPRQSARPNEYEPVEKVATDPLLSKIVAAQMHRDWTAMKRRWADYEEFWHMVHRDDQAA